MMTRKLEQKGFTLIELMLAMVLFSAVLVISTVGFIGMTRTFNRGTIKKQLSEAVQQVSEDVTRTLRSQPSEYEPVYCDGIDVSCKDLIPGNWRWLSFASSCYLWQAPAADSSVARGLFKSIGACKATSIDSKTELMSGTYVVRSDLAVSSVGGLNIGTKLYSVSGVFSTADSDAIHEPVDVNDRWRCKGTAESPGVTACAVEQFNFIVNPRGNSK